MLPSSICKWYFQSHRMTIVWSKKWACFGMPMLENRHASACQCYAVMHVTYKRAHSWGRISNEKTLDLALANLLVIRALCDINSALQNCTIMESCFFVKLA